MRNHLFISVLAVAVLGSVLTGCSGAPKSSDAAATDQTATPTQASTGTPAPFAADSGKAAEGKAESKGLFGGVKDLVPTSVTVPSGTVVAVRLQNTVSSASARAGDTFQAVLDDDLVVKGQTVAPKGTPITGRVMEAKSSGRLHDSGYLRLTLSSMTLNGNEVPLQTTSLFAKGANHNRRNAALIGGGAGAGALIGGLAGGGKGALIGGLVGAGAGTGGAYATGKKEVAFSAERRLSFRLTQAFTTKS
jgi:hypothetical protein